MHIHISLQLWSYITFLFIHVEIYLYILPRYIVLFYAELYLVGTIDSVPIMRCPL